MRNRQRKRGNAPQNPEPVLRSAPVDAAKLARDFDRVPEAAGIYFIFFRNADRLLRAFRGLKRGCSYADAQLLYIGGTEHNLRGRIKSHLVGTTRGSSLRGTLGVILQRELRLQCFPQTFQWHFGEGEERLTKWILENALVAYAVLDDAMAVEKALIEALAPPLNITARRTQTSARQLLALRSRRRFQGNTRSPEYRRFSRWRQSKRQSATLPQYYARLLPREEQARA